MIGDIMQEDYDSDNFSMSDIDSLQINVNPNNFLYRQIFLIQNSLNKDTSSLEYNIALFRMNVEMLETMAESLNAIDEDYEKNVKKYVEDIENSNKESKESSKMFKVSNYKFKLLCSNIFENQTTKSPLKA